MAFLNKQLLLLGEANKLYMEEIDRLGPEANKVGVIILSIVKFCCIIA